MCSTAVLQFECSSWFTYFRRNWELLVQKRLSTGVVPVWFNLQNPRKFGTCKMHVQFNVLSLCKVDVKDRCRTCTWPVWYIIRPWEAHANHGKLWWSLQIQPQVRLIAWSRMKNYCFSFMVVETSQSVEGLSTFSDTETSQEVERMYMWH